MPGQRGNVQCPLVGLPGETIRGGHKRMQQGGTITILSLPGRQPRYGEVSGPPIYKLNKQTA